MSGKLTIQVPVQGWKQFLASRKEMLDAFDSARAKGDIHEVRTFHGNVAEAQVRRWLKSFLPKRYGVTSGYILSPGLSEYQKVPHYDVIIYDQLESPILWIEDSPDKSEGGQSLAIPVEHVRCVIEVKSSLSASTMKAAMEHLGDLSPLLTSVDSPDERYKLHLLPVFTCGAIFFELRDEHKSEEGILSRLVTDAPTEDCLEQLYCEEMVTPSKLPAG